MDVLTGVCRNVQTWLLWIQCHSENQEQLRYPSTANRINDAAGVSCIGKSEAHGEACARAHLCDQLSFSLQFTCCSLYSVQDSHLGTSREVQKYLQREFWWSQLGNGCYQHLVGGGLGCCFPSYNDRTALRSKNLLGPKGLRLRSPGCRASPPTIDPKPLPKAPLPHRSFPRPPSIPGSLISLNTVLLSISPHPIS